MAASSDPPDQAVPNKTLRWYQGVPRYAWLVLMIAALGWLFDAMDQNLFSLVRQPSVTELLIESGRFVAGDPKLDAAAKAIGGNLTAIFLVGWAIGGFVFGILGDKLGRTRTMIITICIYALFTGLNGFVHSIPQYALCRFVTALGVGGEFAAGASLVAEVWPERSRAMALGTLQALSTVGNMGAAVINYSYASNWRFVYFVGAVPALLVVWIRASVKEPERWKQAVSAEPNKAGSLSLLFADPVLRRNTIAGTLIALAGVGGLWGVGFFLPDLIGSVLKPLTQGMEASLAKVQLARWRSEVFFIQQIGAFFGMFAYAALSERTGRRPALALFLVLAFASVEAAFLGIHDLVSARLYALFLGFCALAPFSAFAVYFPELYPTRLRATGVGFCYNCARLLAAFAPFALGGLAKHFASPTDETVGLRTAAAIIACIYFVGYIGLALAPETQGKPLPE